MLHKIHNLPYLLILSGLLSFSIGLNISYYDAMLKLRKENIKLNDIFDVLMKEIEHQEILQEKNDVRFI